MSHTGILDDTLVVVIVERHHVLRTFTTLQVDVVFICRRV